MRLTGKLAYIFLKLDKALLISLFLILGLGLLMLASASIDVAKHMQRPDFYLVYKQLLYLFCGTLFAIFFMNIRIEHLENNSFLLLGGTFILLLLVLLPGISHTLNGSARWLAMGPVAFQVSELTKLCFVIYLARYVTRHSLALQTKFTAFFKPMLILSLICLLLLMEPDFGTAVVITVTALALLFVSGLAWRYCVFLLLLAVVAAGILVIASPYRYLRLVAFLHPWAHQYDSAYQLTQSLIAFGRGGWHGVGLGNSIQKLFYLPEASSDFLFAVLAEELGLIGMTVLLVLYGILVGRIFALSKKAMYLGKAYHAYLSFGLGVWVSVQVLINLAVNMGLLPTKGLTLPFMSAGGSSLLVMCGVMGILLRVNLEVADF